MYSFEQLMTPLWDTEIVYDESITMVESNGKAEAKLLFPPQEIISVTSADKTKEYFEGKDWIVQDDIFSLTPESSIFRFKEEETIFEKEKPGKCFPTKDGRYSLFSEGHFFHDRQISVTYKKGEETFGFCPAFCGDELPKTAAKLRNKGSIKVVLLGDSIGAGYNSSGFMVTTPFLPSWGNLFVENLRRNYQTEVQLINPSVAGRETQWGMKNAKELVADHKPDLAIIAFGMNDRIPGKAFAENIRTIRDIIMQNSPDTEFILCTTTIPNIILEEFYAYQGDYREVLKELRQPGTAIADFYGMQMQLLEKKRFIDLTGNNVNHPNDFMIRCHAQVLSAMLIS